MTLTFKQKMKAISSVNEALNNLRGAGVKYDMNDAGEVIAKIDNLSDRPSLLSRAVPNAGEVCYVLTDEGEVDEEEFSSGDPTGAFQNAEEYGSIFLTEASANLVAKRRAAEHLLCQIHIRNGWTPDWSDFNQPKKFIFFNHETDQVGISEHYNVHLLPNHFYFESREKAENTLVELGEENIKLLCGVV